MTDGDLTARVLVDTDVVIEYLRGRDAAIDWFESLEERELLLSVITVGELYSGLREGGERDRLETFFSAFELVPLDPEIARRGGLLRRDYGLGLADALIAATAAERGAVLATFNQKHFLPISKELLGLRIPYPRSSG